MEKVRELFQKHLSLLIVLIAFSIVLTNYMVYPTFIEKKLQIMEVPTVKETISENTRITEEMISMVSMPKSLLSEGALTDKDDILNLYSRSGYCLPAGSFFYKEALSKEKETSSRYEEKLLPSETVYVLLCDSAYLKACDIRTGQKVDLFYSEYNASSNKAAFGLLEKGVSILHIEEVSEKESLISLAVSKDGLQYLYVAESCGKISPHPDLTDSDISEIYSVSDTRKLLDTHRISSAEKAEDISG